MIRKIYSLFIILMVMLSMVSPVIAVESISIKDTLEKRALSTVDVDIKTLTATASGVSKVKSEDITLKTSTVGNDLRIEAVAETQAQKQVTHSIAIPVADIKGFNGYLVRITHFNDAGIKDDEYLQEVSVKDGYVILADVQFSSVIVSGFTGSKTEVSYNVNVTDTSFTVTENAASLTITLDGVDDGIEIEEGNISSNPYADYAQAVWEFSSLYDYNDTSGNANNLIPNNVMWEEQVGGSYLPHFNTSSEATFNDVVLSNHSSVFFTANIDDAAREQNIFGKSSTDSLSRIYAFSYDMGIETNTNGQQVTITSNNYLSDEYFVNIGVIRNDDIYSVYYDGHFIASSTITNSDDILLNQISDIGFRGTNSTLDNIAIYNTTVQDDDVFLLSMYYNGTVARINCGEWQPIINGQVQFENVTAGETVYILSADDSVIAASLTKLYEYTKDYTLISESETADNVLVQINATAGANMSESQLVYDVSSLNFTYNMSISSDNSNVTGTYHNGTVTLDTGYLNFVDSFNYNLTFDKLTAFTFWTNWISKTATKAVVEYNSTNSNVEQDFYLDSMYSGTYDIKYSNNTVLANATVGSDGWLRFEDVGGPVDTYKLINDTYTIEKQSTGFTGVSFVGVIFVLTAGYFANRFFRRRQGA